MRAKRATAGALAVLTLTFAALLAMSGSALATTVQGTDFHGTGSVLEQGEVDVLNVGGNQGDTVFLTVKAGNRVIAKNLPYTLGEGTVQGYGDNWTGIVTLDIAGYNTSQLDGTYTIEAYADRTDNELLYTGALYGVYADLPDGSSHLIGTRTVGASDDAERSYIPSDTLYAGGQTYKLAGEAIGSGSLHFPYEAYDEATTIDGVIKYVDPAGNVVASTKVAGIPFEGEQTVEIPSAITSDNGDVYRTVFFKDSVTVKNPGQTSYTIPCAKMSDADKAASNYYVATIQMVDENGTVIATDTVNVTGEFTYTAPASIYKSMAGAGVKAYQIEGLPTIRLSAANDGVTGMARTIALAYRDVSDDAKQVDVTFNLLDGRKRVGEAGRNIGTQKVTVDAGNPTAVPQDLAKSADNTVFNIVGSPEDYAYTFGSGAEPVVNVYYTPEGYEPPGPYDVTVNYVNFLTNEVVDSVTYTSSPDDTGAVLYEVPATFSKDGVDYVRLDGQGDTIEHSYYSNNPTYTVYYRDVNDELTSGTTINTIRVVYLDGGTTVTDGGVIDNGTTVISGDAAAGAADEPTALRLDDTRTYNVSDGDGNNSTLTNEEGIDSNAERIDDDANPLSSGLHNPGAGDGADGGMLSAPIAITLIVVVVAVAVVLALVAWKLRKSRKANEADEG